jgi:hypothetical protein
MDPQAIELLAKIVNNTSNNSAIIVPIIVAFSTLSAGIIAAIVAYKQAKEKIAADRIIKELEIRTDIISRERIKWLERLKEYAGEFYTKLDLQYSHLKRPTNPQLNPVYQEKLENFFTETTLLGNKIILHVNAEKTHQNGLKMATDGALALMLQTVAIRNGGSFAFPDSDYTANKQLFFKAMQEIAKETWKQTKDIK